MSLLTGRELKKDQKERKVDCVDVPSWLSGLVHLPGNQCTVITSLCSAKLAHKTFTKLKQEIFRYAVFLQEEELATMIWCHALKTHQTIHKESTGMS